MTDKAQQIEILLSNDFENMNLDELNNVSHQFSELTKWRKDQEDDGIRFTTEQVKARDLLWFRIKQEENKNDIVKVGDFFHTSWGYDQTNVEMYQVVAISKTGKTCTIKQIGMKTEKDSESYMSDSVQPDPEFVHDKPTLKVKVSRSSEFHPYRREHEEIGSIHLRGSVYYAGEYKHLENLYRLKAEDSTMRSWYA